jgi:hypothetical protein
MENLSEITMKTDELFKADDKFLPINVYQFPLGNCGGITDTLTKESIYIPCFEGHVSYEDIENKDLIFVEEQRSFNYYALKQVNQPQGTWGAMSGGNLAYSSDSRCKYIYHIHDRYETQLIK